MEQGVRPFLAPLGLLSIQPMSGYDLGRAFSGSVAHFWHADQSQIYRTLDRLAADGQVETEVVPQEDRPSRKVHSLTSAGDGELRSWLAAPLEVDRTKNSLLARLFFVSRLGADAAAWVLDQAEQRTEGELARLREIDPGPADDLAGVLRSATLRYGLASGRAELVWLRDTRRHLDAVESVAETGQSDA